MWKLLFNVIDIIFQFGSLKGKTHKVQKNNAPFKTFKNTCFWDKEIEKQIKLQLIWTYENMIKF
jgi:hypothetical protein